MSDQITREELTKNINGLVRKLSSSIVNGGSYHSGLLTDDLMQIIDQYTAEREIQVRVDENKYWLTNTTPAMDRNPVYNEDFHARIASLTNTKKKSEL